MAATPSMAADLLRRTTQLDVRHLLPSVSAPTLVLHRRDTALLPSEGVRWLADHLPDGRYVELPGNEVPAYLGDVDGLMDEVEELLVGTRTGRGRNRRVLTVLFSDIVGSTERAASAGDSHWRNLLDSHRREARRLLIHYGGHEIDTAGDSFLISFDSPSAAIRYGLALCQGAGAQGLEVRIGIHSGEVADLDGDLTGLAVHLGARVAAAAETGRVWVSQTVRDLLIGSEFRFTSKGRRQLKGVPGEWELFEVER
jgi:class 3 adenylate cyclase